MIQVTKPFLPPEEEYQTYLSDIWHRQWLTNNGPLVKELELGVKNYLNLSNFSFLSNGTIALQLAIKALAIQGEIITTPFSYVATTSSIVWEGCKPVFVDIDPDTFNIDPACIENAITVNTSAILATHVYGNPCDVEAIDAIAKKNNLKVIYDAAHCFGTTYKGKSILNYGDISTISFHATKLFHTVEGGGIVSSNEELITTISKMRNFGHAGPEHFEGIGINGKNSEFHAAMGLVNLRYIDKVIEKRKDDYYSYEQELFGLGLKTIKIQEYTQFNCSYFAVQFDSEQSCLAVIKELNSNDIYPRRYFYPLLSSLDYVQIASMPVAEKVSKSILCLPMYFDLEKEMIKTICSLIKKVITG